MTFLGCRKYVVDHLFVPQGDGISFAVLGQSEPNKLLASRGRFVLRLAHLKTSSSDLNTPADTESPARVAASMNRTSALPHRHHTKLQTLGSRLRSKVVAVMSYINDRIARMAESPIFAKSQ